MPTATDECSGVAAAASTFIELMCSSKRRLQVEGCAGWTKIVNGAGFNGPGRAAWRRALEGE